MFSHWDATLESKLIKKIDLISKNVNNKKYAPKLVFFNEKKLRKIGIIFALKINFESQILALFGTFLHLPITPFLKI